MTIHIITETEGDALPKTAKIIVRIMSLSHPRAFGTLMRASNSLHNLVHNVLPNSYYW